VATGDHFGRPSLQVVRQAVNPERRGHSPLKRVVQVGDSPNWLGNYPNRMGLYSLSGEFSDRNHFANVFESMPKASQVAILAPEKRCRAQFA
jgi:hypothetical protein